MLPADILDRKKRGFGAPMGAWLKRELAAVLKETLSPEAIEHRGWLRSAAPVARLIADHEANRVDGTDRLLALRQPRDLGAHLPRRARARRRGGRAARGGGMKILYVCHRFPFPPKRGGKIRPFNMIRHFARTHEVTVCSLVRSEAEAREGEGLAEHCHRYEMVRVHDPLQMVRMVARAADAGAVVDGLLPRGTRCGGASRAGRCASASTSSSSTARRSRSTSSIFDIPKILDFGDMDSQKWLEYAQLKPFPLSLGLRARGLEARARGSAARAPLRPVHRDHAGRVGDARGDAHGRPHRLVSQRRRQRVLRAVDAALRSATASASSAAWTTTRTRSACSASART